jgi:hypothetical protein
MTNQVGKNMLIVTQSHMGEPTFSLIAATEDCPFVECIYTPQNKQLAIISKIQKDTFHFFSKIDDNGDVMPAKKVRLNGKTYKEERKQIKTFYEYYLTEEKEILDFVNLYATNPDGFKIANYTSKK